MSESSPDNDVKENLNNFCQRQIKFLRNWSVHGQLSDTLREKDIAFFFMIAMRAIIEMPINRSNKYERQLGVLFDKQKILNRTEMKRKLTSSYKNLLSLYSKYNKQNPYNYNFTQLITEIGQSKFVNKEIMRKESLKLFYQNFWHYLNPIEFKIPKSDNEYIQMNILFKYNEFKSVFPKMIGEWIFSESF